MARFSSSGFLKGLILALILVSIGVYAFKRTGWLGGETDSPATLAGQALDALEAVKRRQPTDRRPASYDKVLAPLDIMLRQAKTIFESDHFNPATDVERIRAYALPVIDIATQADRQARPATGPMAKEYRFNDQKGEAAFYL
ncbi:MAG: hypothetical protein LIP23_10080, partial [Planctomycetes bacterium]|nr:hypothetical protein [Planctomycetota bacterium]